MIDNNDFCHNIVIAVQCPPQTNGSLKEFTSLSFFQEVCFVKLFQTAEMNSKQTFVFWPDF